jgi:hypothetical protein
MRLSVSPEAPGTHLACYCVDCQGAARHLGAEGLLDDKGGTEIFQTLPAHVTIEAGAQHLALMRLSPKGVLRWHAGCCGTPITNTLPSPGLSFCGMVLPAGTDRFRPITARVNAKSARAPVREHGLAAAGYAVLRRAIRARLTGLHRRTRLFDASGNPVVPPRVLSLAERTAGRAG